MGPSSRPRPKEKSPNVCHRSRSGEGGNGPLVIITIEPCGSPKRIGRDASKSTIGGNGADQELDSWTIYITCKWSDNPEASPLLDCPDIIPDSEPTSSTSASEEFTGSSEEDLASVPSTVQIGSPGSSGREGNASPVKFHGGIWRNSDGS